jgi:protein tyrosine phosphatase
MTFKYYNYITPSNYVTQMTFNANLYRSIMPNGCYDVHNIVSDIWKERQFDWIICLCKKGEFLRKAQDTQHNIYNSIYPEYKCMNFPIQNYKCPSNFKHLLTVLGELKRLLDNGEKCVIHCSAGVGRTGLLIACYLIYCGKTIEEAIKLTKININPALKMPEQFEYLETFRKRLNKHT